MSILIKGLRYIIPCQSALCSRKSADTIIQEQYENISKTVKSCLWDNNVVLSNPRGQQAFSMLEQLIRDVYSKPIPKSLMKRAKDEYQIVRSIRNLLKQRPDIIIRRTDKSKVFYVGKRDDFERKSREYMEETEAYEQIIDQRCPLADNLRAVQTLLDFLVDRKVLPKKKKPYLVPKLNKLELAHYHGLPKTHKPGIPLRPIVASMHAPATLLSQFLNNLFAPIYLHEARATTFVNSIDVVRRLKKYEADGYMTVKTKFITSDVKNLYTMIPREGALDALARFCIRHAKQGKIGPFTIDHIMKIARLILDTNTFAYNDKYYRQTRGGAMGSAFTQVLANIYMYEWEQDLIAYQAAHDEIFGRYLDDILMTTNGTIDEMKQLLEKAGNKDVNIKINYQIDRTVDFLDVSISNEDGRLRTKIYHKPAAEPYILPFTSTHPQHIQRNIPYGAIVRAARICSNLDDFHSELCHIDVSLLLNGYPPNFIQKQFDRLFRSTPIVSMSDGMDEESYQQLHHRLLHQPTRHEQKLKKMMTNPIESPSVLQPYVWNKQIMFLHYLFDHARLAQLRDAFMNWWRKYFAFPDSPLCDVKVRLVGDTQKTLEKFLIQKKPRRDLLTKME